LGADDLFDTLEMCGQRAAVGIARSGGRCMAGCGIARRASLADGRLDIVKTELELVGIDLLGTSAEAMAHEGIDDRLQPLDLGIRLTLSESYLSELAALLESERAKRFNVFGKPALAE